MKMFHVMKMFRVTISLDIEALDRDQAARIAEIESPSSFHSIEGIRELTLEEIEYFYPDDEEVTTQSKEQL